MKIIQKDFLPADLKILLEENEIDGSVVIQSDQSANENEFQLKNAAEFDFIKGVVGWIDLQADNVVEKLSYYKQFKKLKGFRHVLQGEAQRDLMLQPAFKKGIGLLRKFGFTYDLLIFPDQLMYAKQLVEEFPDQLFVLDHIAKPDIKNKKINEWKKDILALGAYENVYCKLSGMVTEADWKTWATQDFIPYIDVVVNAFGTKRIMFGSDWPVCLVAASYKRMKEIVDGYFSFFSKNEQKNFYGKTASTFYNL
jgi:L-fuconolactonase